MTWTGALIFLFIVIRIASGIFGIDPHNSFFGSQIRMGGNLGYIVLFGWLAALLFFLRGREEWNKFLKASVLVAAISATFAVIQAFFPEGFGILEGKAVGVAFLGHRLSGTLGNPIFLSGYLLPNIFLSGYLAAEAKTGKQRIIWAVFAVFLTIITLLTQTRGAILALAAAVIILTAAGAGHSYKYNRERLKKYWLVLPLAAALIIFVFLNKSLLTRLLDINTGTSAPRLLMWKIGLSGFAEKRILGWGAENYSYVFSKYYDPELLKYSFYETWADKPHNQFVEIAAESGIFGLALFLGIFVAFFYDIRVLIKTDRGRFFSYLFLSGVMISYGAHIFFSFDTVESRIIIFAALAYVIFLRTIGPEEKQIIVLNRNLERTVMAVLIIASAASLWLIGAKTLGASFYASEATNALVDNNYGKSAKYAALLDKTKSPYETGTWETFSDIILQRDAAGKAPASVMRALLPIITKNLRAMADKYPDNFSYAYRLAQMYHLAGTYIDRSYNGKSIQYLEKSKALSPKRQVVPLFLAQVYFAEGDIDKAIATLEELVKNNENISEPYWYLGILYDAKGEYDKSYAFMSTAAEKGRPPKNINEEILYVTVLGRFKDYAAMAPIYESIIKKDPENSKWWANLAAVYLELKKYDKAREAAHQAIFLDPRFGDEGEKFIKKVDKAESNY